MQTQTVRIFKEKGRRWCRLVAKLEELEGKGPRLSLTGEYGESFSPRAARAAALASWCNYFEDDRAALADMALRFGTRTVASAARKVLEVDGNYHGLDVVAVAPAGRPGRVYVVEGCGACHEELRRWFPGDAGLLAPWHLNDMIGAPCPECGYRYGTAWLYRPLPAAVLEWFKRNRREESCAERA